MSLKAPNKSLLNLLKYDKSKIDVYVVLLSAPVLLLLFRYAFSAEQFSIWFADLANRPLNSLYKYIFHFCSLFVLIFILPLLYILLRMKQPLNQFGFSRGDYKFAFKLLAWGTPLFIIPASIAAAVSPGIRDFYPLSSILLERPDLFWVYEIFYILFYYTAWEFYFRGFMLFPLAREYGPVPAILIQTMASALVHIGTPADEVAASVIGGVALGIVAYRTNSFYYVFFIHAALSVIKDYFIVFRIF